jgi:hypothetical protein
MNKFSEYLYARPSFWEGVARLMDLSGSLSVYNSTDLAGLSDRLAIENDFKTVNTTFVIKPNSTSI